jgi:hypothetical protein
MNILQLIGLMAQQDDCPSSSPTIDTISKDVDTMGACPDSAWHTEWGINLTGSLQPDQEFYVEYATNSSYDNWSFYGRQTGLTISDDGLVGTSGPGGPLTEYRKFRVYVVPTGGSVGEACSGPTTSAGATRTGESCVT